MSELDRRQILERLRRFEHALDRLASAIRRFKRADLESGLWTLERVGIAVAIAVGIGSTIATAVAAVYAGNQAELSRQRLAQTSEMRPSSSTSKP